MTTVCYLTDWECLKTSILLHGAGLLLILAGFPVFLWFTRKRKGLPWL